MFRIAVCDNDIINCSEMEQAIMEYGKSCIEKIDIRVYSSGKELCKFMQEGERFDLIFLNIIMQMESGIETAKFIRNVLNDELVQLIFMSEEDNLYKEIFDVRPMHLLSKPIDKAYLFRDIQKAMELSEKIEHFFQYKIGTVTYKKEIKDILYFEANGRKIRMVAVDGEVCFYGNISAIHAKLDNCHFLHTHQSYLVNYHYIVKYGLSELRLTNTEILPISRQKRKEVIRMIISYSYDK